MNSSSTDIITCIDSKLYKAAAEGKIEQFKDYTEPLNPVLTPTKNTILHIHITHQTNEAEPERAIFAGAASCFFMDQILTKCPVLLLQTNEKGETPLHMAARHGHGLIVHFLIDWAKAAGQDIESGGGDARPMLRMENVDKETALHEAVRHNNPTIVQILTEEDPDFTYSANGFGETPLYLAVERGFSIMAFQILITCKSPAFNGPNGRTALHEAAIRNNLEITAKIIETKASLAKEVDQQGWAPLHHASHFGHVSIVKLLLECDRSVAYVGDNDGMIPLHLAAARGNSHAEVIAWILVHCPDCNELVDHKGRNVLHFAVKSASGPLLTFFLDGSNFPSWANLINQKDVDGNTPLHLLASYCLDNTSLIGHPSADKMAVNNNNFTPLDVVYKSTEDHNVGLKGNTLKSMKKRGGYEQSLRNLIEVKDGTPDVINSEEMERTKTSHMIVATLIVTVTFTAGFTMPGGYNDDKGTAIMSKNGAFVTFVITDALALLLSTCALFFYYSLEFDGLTRRFKQNLLNIAALFIMVSIFLMLIAFASAVYAVLYDSIYLRVIVCFIISFSLLICYSPLKHLLGYANVRKE